MKNNDSLVCSPICGPAGSMIAGGLYSGCVGPDDEDDDTLPFAAGAGCWANSIPGSHTGDSSAAQMQIDNEDFGFTTGFRNSMRV